MAGNQLDNIMILDAGLPRTLESTDNLQITSTVEFQNDVEIQGNLIVNGTITSIETETLRVADNHILLNDGYTAASPETAGLVANYLPTATADTVAATGFVAGVPATSNPTVNTVGAATFAASDLVLITNPASPENGGLFEVLTHAANLLTIRGVGLTATVEDFTQNQFVADTTVQGAITKVNVSIIRAGTDGAWEVGQGAVTGITFTDLGTGGGNTLDQAYQAGNQITTSGGDGDVIIAGTEALQITATNGLNVDTIADFDVTTFDVQMTGSNGFSLDGTAASNITITAGNLTLSTLTSGNLILSSVGAVTIDAVESSNLTMAANNAAARTLTIAATNAGAGTGNLTVTVDDTLAMDATAFSIDGTAASNVSVTGAALTLSTLTSGDLVVLAAGDVDIDGANVLIDATAGVSIDSADTSNLTMAANNAAARTLTIAATNAGAGTGNLTVTVDDTLAMDATAFSIDGTAASNVSVTGAELQLSTITSGELDITSAGLLDINAAANIDIDVTGTFDMLATGAFSIDGTGASNVSADSGNLTLSTTTSGSLLLVSAGDSTYTIPNASTTAFSLTDGSEVFINVDSTAGAESLDLPQFVDLSGGAGITLTTNDTLVAGDIVQIEADGDVGLAEADTGDLTDGWVVAISRGAASIGNPAQLYSVPGTIAPVRFTAAPAGAANGLPAYLSNTAGQATTVAPTGAGNKVTFVIGIIQGADGALTTVDVLFQPQFISKGPGVS